MGKGPGLITLSLRKFRTLPNFRVFAYSLPHSKARIWDGLITRHLNSRSRNAGGQRKKKSVVVSCMG